MVQIDLPFYIWDGKETRKCDYRDLIIIFELKLEYKAYSKEKKWFFFKKEVNSSTLPVLYSCIKSIQQSKNIYSYVTWVDNTRISKVHCKSLYRFKDNPFVDIMLGLM